MRNIIYALILLFCFTISQTSHARYEGDKWIPDTPQQKKALVNDAIKQRVNFASQYERELLSKGMDVDVTVSGPEKKTFKMKYILLGRPLVYKLTVEGQMLESLHAMGFTKVILTDGHDNIWTYDLKKIFSPKK